MKPQHNYNPWPFPPPKVSAPEDLPSVAGRQLWIGQHPLDLSSHHHQIDCLLHNKLTWRQHILIKKSRDPILLRPLGIKRLPSSPCLLPSVGVSLLTTLRLFSPNCKQSSLSVTAFARCVLVDPYKTVTETITLWILQMKKVRLKIVKQLALGHVS